MKKRTLTIFVLVCVVFGAIWWFMRPMGTIPAFSSPTPTQAPVTQKITTVTWDGQTYAYAFFEAADVRRISFIPNFSDKKTTAALVDERNCSLAANGGFYDESGRPLGLFITNNTTLRNQVTNSLINGFFWATSAGNVGISSSLPDGPFVFALQSGPLLMQNATPLPLRITNDEHARRMIAAKTSRGLAFIAVYTADSVFGGPRLANVPEILGAIASKEPLDIADAINLDGGSASAFYNGEISLSELTPVGSFFCVN